MRLQEIFEVRIVEDNSELATRLFSEVPVDSDFGGQAYDGATYVGLLARFYSLIYIARVARGQASHYYHHLKKRKVKGFSSTALHGIIVKRDSPLCSRDLACV